MCPRTGEIWRLIKACRDQNGGVAEAIATKMLHPKRRATVPVCDNQSIFYSFLVDGWKPGDELGRSGGDLLTALHRIHESVTRLDNNPAWERLHTAYPHYQRIELFDMSWWTVRTLGARLVEEDDGCYALPDT
jgi:hypothetical protein